MLDEYIVKQSESITDESFKTTRLRVKDKSFYHYSACQGRSLRKHNLIAIESRY